MKKSIIPVAAFIAGMAIVPSVFATGVEDAAESETTYKTAGDLSLCLQTNDEDGHTCKLDTEYNGVAVNLSTAKLGKKITLDLNGRNLVLSQVNVEGEFTVINSGAEALLTINGSGDGIFVNSGATFTVDDGVILGDSTGINTLVANYGTAVIDGSLSAENAQKAIANIAGKTTVNTGASIDAKNIGIETNGGELTINGATVNAETGSAVRIVPNNSNLTTVAISKSTLTSEEDDVIYVNGAAVKVAKNNTDLGLPNLDENKKEYDLSKFGALKSFTLANVNLKTEGEDKHVYNNAGAAKFASWDADGKSAKEAALNTLAEYNTINAATVEPGDEPEADEGDKTENPNTADTIATYMTIAAVALLGLGATAFVAKKSNR